MKWHNMPPALAHLSLKDAAAGYCNLFALWIVCGSLAALRWPDALRTQCGPYVVTGFMGLLSFLVGMTAKPQEFRTCLVRPKPVFINIIMCYSVAPAAAIVLSSLLGLPKDLMVGMVLLGSVPGGSTSNLCALIAGVDVPLSVVLTSTTTLLAALGTPAAAKVSLGAVVPVNARGILVSAVKILLVPVFLGVMSSSIFPRTCKAVAPVVPALGVTCGVFVISVIVAGSAELIIAAGAAMHTAVILLHLLTGAIGYGAAVLAGAGERERRTVALDAAMKNCALGTVLAAAHFQEAAVQVPAAASCIWCPTIASLVCVLWRVFPAMPSLPGPCGKATSDNMAWTSEYRQQ
mmetsp:Transcript_63067/g.150299  ORF Transcript_63067/g.150299 Transcript_63067/m.150299 type:complete len:348 (-) Transcript_63067:51-1094(-)